MIAARAPHAQQAHRGAGDRLARPAQRREAILMIGESGAVSGVPQSAPCGLVEMVEAGRPATPESDVVVVGWARRSSQTEAGRAVKRSGRRQRQ